MKIDEIIDKLSVLYRASRANVNELTKKKMTLEQELFYAKENRFENITHAKYEQITLSIQCLESEIKEKEKYCDGIFDAREVFLNLK